MGIRRRGRAVLAAAVLLSAGCSSGGDPAGDAAGDGAPTGVPDAVEEPADLDVASTTVTFEDTSRATSPDGDAAATPGRLLETTIWYPSGDGGPYPVVLFGHGLQATPQDYEQLLAAWASAGMVVAAPRFPLTATGTAEDRTDVLEQPADVSFVLDQVLALSGTPGSEIEGLADGERVAAAGHSLGGQTTALLVSECCYEDRLDAAVVLGSGPLDELVPELGIAPPPYALPGVPMLFVHGGADDAIPIERSRLMYQFAPAAKAFVELPFATHSRPYDDAADDSWPVVAQSTTGFLEWALGTDPDGLQRVYAAVEADGPAQLADDQLP